MTHAAQFIDFSFNAGNSIAQEKAYQGHATKTDFAAVLETKTKEATQEAEQKAVDVTKDGKANKKEKETKVKTTDLFDVNKIIENAHDQQTQGVQKTYALLDKIKDRKSTEEDPLTKEKKEMFSGNPNAIGQANIDNKQQGSGKKMSRSQMLSIWEKMSPSVTEDGSKKTVRIDIPLLKDVRTLILRLHGDRSVTASLLGSEGMAELIKQHKDKLEKNFRNQKLSLREFNTYRSELELNSETGTRKKKKNNKEKQPDLISV